MYATTENLKSSMDRFIVSAHGALFSVRLYLKSSMDRFIAAKALNELCEKSFKIQYG